MTEHDFIRTFIFVLYPGAIGTILFFTAWVFQVYLAAVFSVVTQCSFPPPPLHCGEEYCVTTLKTAAKETREYPYFTRLFDAPDEVSVLFPSLTGSLIE